MLNKIKSFIITFCVSVLIFGSIAYFIVNFATDALFAPTPNPDSETNQSSDNINNPIGEQTGENNQGEDEETTGSDVALGSSFTALLVGTDHFPSVYSDYDLPDDARDEHGFPINERAVSADLIMMVQINKELKQFIFTPFYGNTRVTVNGKQVMLSSLYDSHGIDFLCEQIRAMTGITVDYYATASAENLAATIDELGGIEYSVPIDMVYEEDMPELSINLKAGRRTLSGNEVLQLLRFTSYPEDSSLSRATVSIDFVKALLAKFTTSDYINKAITLYGTVTKNVKTDFTTDDLAANLGLIFSYSEYDTVSVAYPGTWSTASGAREFVPNIASGIKLFSAYKNLS